MRPDVRVAQRLPLHRRARRQVHLLDTQPDVALVEHLLEELGHVRPQHLGGQAVGADLSCRHDRVRTGLAELVRRASVDGLRHDSDAGIDVAGGHHDVQVLLVVVEGRHERSRTLETGRQQDLVVGRVADDVRGLPLVLPVIESLEMGLVVVDHDERSLRVDQLADHVPSGPPGPAHDHVVAQAVDVLLHAPSPKDLAKVALEDESGQ